MVKTNIKATKKCAFCKYWYDPTNSCINPKAPKVNLWEFDMSAKKKCLKRNTDMVAGSYCKNYECKVPIM